MMRVVLIGAGNIMTTRHVPALRSAPELFTVVGVIDRNEDKARKLAHATGASHHARYTEADRLASLDWLHEVDAAIVATPPLTHEHVVDELLDIDKHVLVEKPFTMTAAAGERLVEKAAKRKLILALNHNFQYSRSFQALQRLIVLNELGSIRSFYSVQFSNNTRRLPIWAEDLPLGLFYDESPHVFYLLRRFGGSDPMIEAARAIPSKSKPRTPQVLNVEISTSLSPAHLYLNFESPICEWYFTVVGEKRLVNVDMFRDILTVLPNDGQHLMAEVLRTSALLTWQHWRGFIASGLRYVCKRLHYGMDVTQRNFWCAVMKNDVASLNNMDGQAGIAVVRAQHDVIRAADDTRDRSTAGT